MKIITIYAVVRGEDIITTEHNQQDAIRFARILNKTNKTKDYIVVPCNGLVI